MSESKFNGGRALRIAVGLMMLGLLLVGGAGAVFLNNEKLTVKDSSDPNFWKIKDEANNSNYESNQIFYKNQDQSKNISISPPQSQNINNVINSFETLSNNTKNQTENRGLFLLKNGFAIRIIAIDQETFPPKLWLALEKHEIKIDDAILNSGEEYSYKNDHDEIKVKVEGFGNKENSIIFLENIYQSSNGEILLNYENSTLYPSNSISSFQVTIDRVNSNFLISDEIGLKQTAAMGLNAVRQITVDDDGPADYSSIQQSIDAANNGDTIYVKNGTYFEHLLIVKNNLTITGENINSTIIDGGGDGDVIVLMGANNNTIKEITIQNAKSSPAVFPPVSGNTRVFLKENYSLVVNAIDARTSPRQAWLTLSKNDTVIDEIILEEGTSFNEDRTGKLILSLRVDKIFAGSSSDYISLSNITQYSDTNLNIIVQNKTALLKVGEIDDFVPLNGGIEWGLDENYALSILDVDTKAFPRKAMLLLSKNGAPVEFKILTAGEVYTFYKNGKLILRADIEAIFGGQGVYLAKLSHVYQYSESTSSLLLNDGMHLYIVGSPRTLKWELFQNYSLTSMDIDSKSFPRLVWFEFSKDGVVIEDKILQSGNDYSFYKDGLKILSLNVGEIFDGRNSDLAFVSKVYQYSETDVGTVLKQNETHIFHFGSSSGIDWPLYENYTISFMDADINIFPVQAWMRMKRNGETIDDKIVAINQIYSYTNPSSRLIFNGKIDTIFSANLDFLKIINANQYSEVDGKPLILNAVQSFYPNNIEFIENMGDKFQLYENYVIIPVDISARTYPRTVWIRLYKSGTLVDERIMKAPVNSSDYQNYSYNSSGRVIIFAKMDAIFSGATSDMIQFKDFYQYSETDGTLLMYIQKKTLAGPRFSKNNAGVTLDGSNGNKIQGLRSLINNYGIYLKNSSFNNISNNNIVNNSNGVYIKYIYYYLNGSYVYMPSIDNLIFHNVFLNNTRNGYDDYSTNRWDNGYFEGGNFWSDYAGIDEDKDGVGDTPYYVNSGRDNFPLIAPWNGTLRVPKTVYVDDDFVDDPSNHKWNTIQKGIADSHYDDTILVYNGTYYENVILNKKLTLIGIDNPVVYGSSNKKAIEITANNCNIDGFTFAHSDVGIFLNGADSTILTNNTIFDNSYGIRLSYSAPSTLRNNEIRDNNYNLDVSGWSLEDYMHDIDTSNTVNGKPVYYLVGQSNRVFDSSTDAGYIGIVNSSNIVIKDLTLTNNYQGVLFAYTSNSRIENIDARNNYYGVDIRQSSSNTFINNRMASNQYGINLESSSNNVMSGNNASNNWIGFNIYRSPFNSLINNIAVDNSNYGVYVYGYENVHYNNDIGTSNTVNRKPVYYYYGLNNQIIQNLKSTHLTVAGSTNVVIMNNNISGGDGIHLALSDGSSIQNNAILDNYYGIHLHSSNDVITGNTISDNSYGIFVDGYSSNQIIDNILDSNRYYNIYLSGTTGNTLTGNNISKGNGITMWYSSGNKLTGNIINTENLGMWVDGWNADQFNNSIDTSNIINGRPIYYYYNIHDQIIKNLDTTHLTVAGSSNITIIDNSISGGDGIILPYNNDSNITSNTVISNGQYGIYLKESYKNKITSNNIINNDYSGVYIYQSSNNELKNNTISNNNYGVYSYSSQNNILYDNELYSNYYGIETYNSQNNTMRHNTILGSNYGFYLYSSSNNRLYGNNLLYNNYANAYDYGSNYWNNETIGNYWDNYNGVDEDNNGIGDTQYNISGGSNQDHYPLMELYNWKMPEPKQIYVDDDFIDDPVNHKWNTINEGLGDAFYNDSIIVYSGTYNEYVRISKKIRLIGIGMPVVNHSSIEISADRSTLDGFKIISGEIRVYSDGNLILNNTVSDGNGIYLSSSSNNTLRSNIMVNNSYNLNIGGNSLTDYINDIDTSNTIDGRLIYYLVNANNQIIDSTSNAGFIGVINSSGITIRDITLRNNNQGVLFYHTNDSRIENVDIYSSVSGILLSNSYGNYVANNSLNSTGEVAIYLLSSANNTLRDNKVKSNYLGIIVIGETKESYNNSIGSSNTLNGKPIYYFYDLHDTTIQGLDTSHLTVASSNNVTIKNNNIKNGDIVFLPFLSNSTIMNNTVQDNLYGIYLLFLSNNNTVYHNNLINNTINAIDAASSNQWDNGSEGNYWSAYVGMDEDHDGIGDTPYNISGNHVAQDRYPFMKVSGWLGDITPPASIKNPHASSFGTTWINWTWMNPSEVDFNHTMLYLDGSFVDNFSITYYNATNLLPSSTHTISTHTVDTSGNINQTWINDTALTAGDLSNGLNINVYKPQNFSVYPVGETLRFDIEVTDSVGNPVDSGTSANADLSGPNDASRQIILTKNGTNFTGEYVVQKDDRRGIWIANITAYNSTNSGRVSVKILIIGAYIIQPGTNSPSYVLGETANFSARVVKSVNPSQILTDNNLSLNMTVYHFNSSTPVLESGEMLFNDTAGLFYGDVDTGLLGSGMFTVVFNGNDTSGNVENASMMIGVSENFSITTSTDRKYYDRGEPVNIFGTVKYDNNSPISNANVSIQLNLQGFKRAYSVITNETGSYNYTFKPFAAEAGNYSVKATVSNIGLQRTAQSDFTTYGLYLAPQSATVNMVENSTQKINFTLYNLGDTKLTGIKSIIKDLDNSDTATATINPADISSELLPYNSTSITVQINAGTPVPDNAVIQLEVTTDQNSNEMSELNVNLFSPIPIVKVYPENIQIGLNKNQTVIKTVTIANIGYGLLKNITLHQPNNNWSRITSNTSLGDLNPGENASFDVHINSYNIDLGTYYDKVNITSDNYDDVKVNLTAYVTDLNNGSLLFHVRDALEKELQDANISLINQETYEEFDIITNTSGYALLNNLPIGRYIFEVSSDGTNTLPQTGTVEVEAMETPKLIEISLYMSFIDFDWEVIPTSIEDYYNVILRMRFETDVPIPLLLAFPPNIEYNMVPGEEKIGTFTLYNVGLVSIYNVTISPIKYNGIILDPLITDVGEIKGKSNIQIPYKIKLASNAANCQELSGKINIRGRYLHFINNHEVISYIGTTVPVLVRTPFDDSCSIHNTIPNFCFNIDGFKFGKQTENLSVNPSTIWFITGEEGSAIGDNSLLIEDVSIATNHNQLGDIKFSKALGMTFSFGVEDVISYLIPGASLSFDVIGDGANIPYFNGIWSGVFTPDIIAPEQHSNLNIERQTSGVGVTLPELIGGGIGFQFGNTTCYNCVWILPMGGVDVSTPHFVLPNITIYHPEVRLIEGTVGGGGTFCWTCFPDVFIVPTLPHFGGTTYVPWDWPEWVWNVPYNDPIRPTAKPKVTQTIHEVVELSISQNVTLERDAFWAGLGIRNRMPDKNINDVRVNLKIKGNGGLANDKFFIQAPRLKGINSLDGSGVISPSALAKAQWLMIPKSGAGGANPEGTKYNISANISYSVDGINFEISTQEVEILVKPQPEIVLDYFIPSDVIANKPFKLAVKATNEGYGPARNFSIETAQPVIYYNPSGLLIDFEIIRSQLQGQERSTSLKVDFGIIKPGESKLAWWDMVTSFDGTFTEFTGEYTHSSELGGMETSLIKKINTYIIQKQMGTGEIGYDFLANLQDNETHYMLFNSSTGNSTFLSNASYTVVDLPTPDNPVLDLSIEDYTGDWVIVSIEDPYNNEVPIEKVIRTRDGSEIPSYNYWMRNGRILIVDHYEAGFDGKYSIKFINTKPLKIIISSPINYGTYAYDGSKILFGASIEGGIAPYDFYWISNLDGDLSLTKSSELSTDTFEKELSEGMHFITLKVTDGSGNIEEQKIRIYIEKTTISAHIDSPYPNSCFVASELVKFEGSVSKGIPPYHYKWISDIDGLLNESVNSYESIDTFERQFSQGERKIELIVTDSTNSISESLPIKLNISDDESTSVCINAMPLTGGLISKDKNNPTIVTLDSTLYFYYKTRPGTMIELELIEPDNSIKKIQSTAGTDGITVLPIDFSEYDQEGEYIVYLKKVDNFDIPSPSNYYIRAYSNVFGLNMIIAPKIGVDINGKIKNPLYSSAFIYGNSITSFNQFGEQYAGAHAGLSIEVPRELTLDYKGSKEMTDSELINSDFGLGISKEQKFESGVTVGENIKIMQAQVGSQSGADFYRKWWTSDRYNFGSLRNEPNWGKFVSMVDLMIIPSFAIASQRCLYIEPLVTPMYFDCMGRELIELQGLNKYKIQNGNGAVILGAGTNTEIKAELSDSNGKLTFSSEGELGIKNNFNLKDNSKESCEYIKSSGDISSGVGNGLENFDLSLSGKERSIDSCAKSQKDYSLTIHDESTNLFRSNGNEIKFRSNSPTDGIFKSLLDFLSGILTGNPIIKSDDFVKDFFDHSPSGSIDYTISKSDGYDLDTGYSIQKELKNSDYKWLKGFINYELGLELSSQTTQIFEKGYLDENYAKRIIYKKSPNNYVSTSEVSKKVFGTIIKRALMDFEILADFLKKAIEDLYNKINEGGAILIRQAGDTLYYSVELIGESMDQTVAYIDQINPFKDVHIHVIDQYGREVYYDYNNDSYVNQIPGAQIYTNISLNNTVIKDFIILPKNLKFNIYVDGNEVHEAIEPYTLTIATGYNNNTVGTIIRDNITKGEIKQFYVDIGTNNNPVITVSDPTPYICGNGIVDLNETIINCPLDVDTRPPIINDAYLDLIDEKIIVKVNASDDVVYPLVFVNANSSSDDEDIPLEYNATLGLYQVELIPIESDIFNFKVKVYDNINNPPVEQFLKSITIKKNISNEYLKKLNISIPYLVDYYQDGEKKNEIEAFRPFDIIFTLYNGKVEFKDVIAKRINPFNLPAIYPAINVTLSNQTYMGRNLGNSFIELDNLSIQNYLGENATYNSIIKLNKLGSTISAIKCDSLLFGQCINEEVIPTSNYSEQNEYIILNIPHFSSYGLVYENTKDITPPSNVYNLNHEAGSTWILWKWAKLFEPDFNHTEIYLNGTFITNISAPQNFHNTTGLTPNTTYEFSTRTVDNNGNINATWVNYIATTLPIPDVTIPDVTPPSNITNLSSISSTTWLNFTWLNPPDPDFSHVMLYLNGSFKTSILAPQNYYNFTGLAPNTVYELGTHTVDSSGNVNETWVNATGRTLPSSGNANPIVSNPTASHEIPDDTDNEPLWGETAQLNVTVTDDDGVMGVTVDLSEIGGLAVNPMTNIKGNIWSTTTNATSGTLPKIYNLTVNATDIFGNSNTSMLIPLRVMKNGDTSGNGVVNIGDALRCANNVSFPGNPEYVLSSRYVADVTGDGLINIGDCLRLANNVSFQGNLSYILK